MSKELVAQTRRAFDFVRKLFFETSYLVKEVEGQLQQEPEAFVIGRPSGYGVTTRTSSGLEPMNVEHWLPDNFTVFFCPEAETKLASGQTVTEFKKGLRLLILHIDLSGKDLKHPRILCGCVEEIVNRNRAWKKFEHVMSQFAYYGKKIFGDIVAHGNHDGTNFSLKGEFKELPLFSIKSSDDIRSKVVEPMLKLYRK